MTPEEKWDGPIQDAIREHDRGLGHAPASTYKLDYFRIPPEFPTGGATAYVVDLPDTPEETQ